MEIDAYLHAAIAHRVVTRDPSMGRIRELRELAVAYREMARARIVCGWGTASDLSIVATPEEVPTDGSFE